MGFLECNYWVTRPLQSGQDSLLVRCFPTEVFLSSTGGGTCHALEPALPTLFGIVLLSRPSACWLPRMHPAASHANACQQLLREVMPFSPEGKMAHLDGLLVIHSATTEALY